MSKESQNFWFILDNYVHVSVRGKSVLFYNTLTGKILEYSDCEPVSRLVKRLNSPRNLLVIGLTGKELANPEISRFVKSMRTFFMGDLIDASLTKGKPMQMAPYPNIQQDVEFIKKSPQGPIAVGDRMMKYVAEVSLFINSACNLDCGLCGSAHRQFLCCTRGKNTRTELESRSIKNLLQQLQGASLARLNILGGDIFKYSQWEQLPEILTDPALPTEKYLYSHYLNLAGQEHKLAQLPTDAFSLKIVVPFPVKKQQWEEIMNMPLLNRPGTHFLFIIAGETDIDAAEELITRYHLENHSYHPFFNGRNREFFRQAVFVDREDLEEARPTMREILARQCINPLQFGTLTILSNGDIYANVNARRLGAFAGDSIYDMVYKEMFRGSSWRRTRKKAAPCRHCTFNALCPPLSNYEYALGQNNLCHINPRT
ncbi:MAG: pseudo-rSAM protein [Acidobacteriota bacterium]|nr:pseudo-rSAM protein [Acidobacteriota bacterium]